MKNSSILIIADNEINGGFISGKIKLLRNSDSIQVVTYIESISILNSSLSPDLIIVYCANSYSIGIVKEIRKLKGLNKIPVILVLDYFIEELLLNAFDNGIDDFFFMNDSDSVILMRILFTMRKSMLYRQIELKNNILAISKIFEKESGMYLEEYTPIIFSNIFNNIVEESIKNTVFMCIKPIISPNKKMSFQTAALLIKSVLRNTDIAAYGKDSTFYFILYNSNIEDIKNIFLRMKNLVSPDYQIYANAIEIKSPFESVEKAVLNEIKEQIALGIEFKFLNDLTENSKQIDYKENLVRNFKIEFLNELERIVTFAFYQMKVKVLDKFPDLKVNFDITETQSNFEISKGKKKSKLIITYPLYKELFIEIKNAAKSKQHKFELEEFSSEKLLEILENMLEIFIRPTQRKTKTKKSEKKIDSK